MMDLGYKTMNNYSMIYVVYEYTKYRYRHAKINGIIHLGHVVVHFPESICAG